ncbi:hypothetical protein A2160_00285 [Candidatus Beckwithbacteria bacterium RBG_13_42_9]|uniref:Uncharacterized protein n=1 Tax=Candidatus Beckwithbacteria bacterium RBG_13_42_9 TaxID=1797457 RepID=A0A1F5E5A4_9BACT|nr:MAG: hypothetical protein A2160_00285 [Candidatus Beckwithbacteria bacterium RBG_13_42_9]
MKINKNLIKRITLILVTAVVVLLFSLTIFLANLLIITKLSFLKSQLNQANFYEIMVTSWQEDWLKFISQGLTTEQIQKNSLGEKIKEGMSPTWLKGEIERNLDELNNYVNGKSQDLTLNFNFSPVKQQMAEELTPEADKHITQEIEASMPDKIDFFGSQGLFDSGVLGQIYQLKLSMEVIKISLKILFFLIILALGTFFLLIPPQKAWRWISLSLIFSGLLILLTTLVAKVLIIFYLGKNSAAVSSIIATGQIFLANILKVYFGLIAWQAALIFFLGLLLFLTLIILNPKK